MFRPKAASLAIALVFCNFYVTIGGSANAQNPLGLLHRPAKTNECSLLTAEQLAALVDEVDRELYSLGVIGVKSADVWGQNRMTKFRVEYEDLMAGEKGNFQLILNAYQRRSDAAAFVTRTGLGLAIQRKSRGTSTNVNIDQTSSASATSTPSADLPLEINNASSRLPSNTPVLGNPGFANKFVASGADGIGLEPTIALDERSRFLNHLHQLRRINSGDDLSDSPGYGLYLVRIPVSIVPGPRSQRGKGAVVSARLEHEITNDILAMTMRDVAIMEAAFELFPMLVAKIHGQGIFRDQPYGTPITARTSDGDIVRVSHRQAQQPKAVAPQIKSLNGAAASLSPATSGILSSNITTDEDLDVLADAFSFRQAAIGHHDPSALDWLLDQLGQAHVFMERQAHRNPMLFHDQLDALYQLFEIGDINRLHCLRQQLAQSFAQMSGGNFSRLLELLCFRLALRRMYVARLIEKDMQRMAERKGAPLVEVPPSEFAAFHPSIEAKRAFAAYVQIKWPLYVFTLDPIVDQQNAFNVFSLRSELQAALAMSVAAGNVNFKQAMDYARRVERDLATVELNRTAVGFGSGETTFGWRFFPRIQTPPIESNPRRIANLVYWGSTGPNYDKKFRQIEPGMRECVAIVLSPNFIPGLRISTVTNWFDLTGHCNDQMLSNKDMLRIGRKVKLAREGFDRLCDSGQYRSEDLHALNARIEQLESLLPMQTREVRLPFERDLAGADMFVTGASQLGPTLIGWYGEQPVEGHDNWIFVVGKNLSVHETQTIAGTIALASPNATLISRNVMKVCIPKEAKLSSHEKGNFFDLHVATPNGVSNHLMIECRPKAPDKPKASPAAGYALVDDSQTLKIKYKVVDDVNNCELTRCSASPGVIRVSWLDDVGLNANKVNVTFRFKLGNAELSPITLPGVLSSESTGIYEVDAAKLADEMLSRLQCECNPKCCPMITLPEELTTESIGVKPSTGECSNCLTADGRRTNNSLKVQLIRYIEPCISSVRKGNSEANPQAGVGRESAAIPTSVPMPPRPATKAIPPETPRAEKPKS